MLFRFDANQEHQLQAMAAVVDQFEGQPRVEKDLQFELGASFASVPNRLELDEAALLANLRKVQARNGLNPDEGLELVEEPITTAAGPKQARFGSFSVEMETGTGKTYVYLRTALELNRQYGMCKFVIVAPIRERIRDNRRLAGYDKGNNRAAKCFLPAVARMARAPSPRSLSPPAPLAADSL